MSIIDSITGIFSSKNESKKASPHKDAPAKAASKPAKAASKPAKAASKKASATRAAPAKAVSTKGTGSASAMAAHSKDASSRLKSGQPKAASAKKSAR